MYVKNLMEKVFKQIADFGVIMIIKERKQMANNIKVSIVVLTYYHENYIHEALDTILSQKADFGYEIIVMDDCSKDNTVSIVEKYVEKFPDIVRLYSSKENLGICKNHYKGLLKCRGEFVVVTDGDDCWIDDYKLMKQASFLEQHDEFFAVATSIQGRTTKGVLLEEIVPKEQYRGRKITREMFLEGADVCTVGMMMRNVFKTERAKKQFSYMYKFSRDLDDVTVSMFIFDYGDVYNLSDVTYAITSRSSSDQNQHNYNSKYDYLSKDVNRIQVYSQLNRYYKGKLNLTHKFETSVTSVIAVAIRSRNPKVLKELKPVPIKYIIKAVFRWPLMKLGLI